MIFIIPGQNFSAYFMLGSNIRQPSVWTSKDVSEFKDGLRSFKDNIVHVGSLATATVSFPQGWVWLSFFNIDLMMVSWSLCVFLFCLWFSWLCTGCAMNHCDKSSKLVCFVYNQLNPQIPPFSKVTVFLIFSTSNLSYIIGVCSIWPHNLLSNITVSFKTMHHHF